MIESTQVPTKTVKVCEATTAKVRFGIPDGKEDHQEPDSGFESDRTAVHTRTEASMDVTDASSITSGGSSCKKEKSIKRKIRDSEKRKKRKEKTRKELDEIPIDPTREKFNLEVPEIEDFVRHYNIPIAPGGLIQGQESTEAGRDG